MFLDYGKGRVEVVVSVEALVRYEMEFDGADMIQECLGRIEQVGSSSMFDFTQTSWTKLAKAIWACEKTANPSLPGFMEWARSVEDFDLIAVRTEFMTELVRRFFPAGDDAPER